MTSRKIIPLSFALLLALGMSTCKPVQNKDLVATTPTIIDSNGNEVYLIEKPGGSSPGADSHVETPSAPDPIVGIEVNAFSPYVFDWLAQSGAFWLRYNGVEWSDVEPRKGRLNWSALKQLEENLKQAAQLNQEVILVVRGTPGWAQAIPGAACGPIQPEKLAAFGNFMHEMVKRYSPPPYSVKYWELGNEPDIDPALVPGTSPYGCWGDANDEYYGGGRYAEMLKAVYPRIKSADPDAQVLVGGLLLDCDPDHPPENRDCQPGSFLEGILAGGGSDYFDGISYHAYDYYAAPYGFNNQNWQSSQLSTGPVNAVKARFLRNLLEEYEVSDKYLINTEAGLLCGRTGEEPKCQSYEFNLAKAFYASFSNAAAFGAGLKGNIWYNLTGWRGTGLLDAHGGALPAMSAMRFAATQMNGARYVREIQEFPGLTGIEYMRDGKTIWMLWSPDGVARKVQFADDNVTVFDVWGDAVQPDPELTITNAPVYIEWGG